MARCVRYFDVQGLELAVDSDGPLLPWLAPYLQDFTCSAVSPRAFTFELRYVNQPSDLAPDSGLAVTWEAVNQDGVPISGLAGPGRIGVSIDQCLLGTLDMVRRRLRVAVMPGRERCFVRDALPILFAGAMSMAGHHGIHAACLSLGLANDSPSVLLMGPSGSGKTTTAMAMMRGGLCHLADDVTFVVDQPGDGSPRIWGWRTPCKICPDSLLLLPWLAENPAVSGSSTTPTAIPAPGVAGVSRLLVRPRLLLFLSDRSRGDHVLEPIDNLTAVQSLIKENLRTRHPELRDVAGAGFRILTRLVASCRSFKLHAGPRLETLVAHVGPMLREVDT